MDYQDDRKAVGIASGHRHDHRVAEKKLRVAVFLTVFILAAEVAGGLLANSLALLGDAGHVLTDLFALCLTWYASVLAAKPPTSQRTYGYHRVGIMVALVNAVALILVVLGLAYEAVWRLGHPQVVQGTIMWVAALVGILLNGYIGLGLQEQKDDLNIRSVMIHVFGDMVAGIAVIIAAIWVALTKWYAIDPIISLILAGYIAVSSWEVLGESVNILMEGTPRGIDLDLLVRRVVEVSGVQDIHDLHVWSLGSCFRALSAHLLVDDQKLSESELILEKVRLLLACEFGIQHSTIQLEHRQCGIETIFCALEGHVH